MPNHVTLKKQAALYDFGPMAVNYDDWYKTPQGQQMDRLQKIDLLTLLPCPRPGDRLLDAGCGTGHWSRFFARYGYSVTGIDISPEMIHTARQRCRHGCSFEVADVTALPFESEYFDVVASIATVSFLSDVPAALSEMFRCLKTGGTMIIGALNRLSPVNRQRLAAGKQPYASGRLPAPRELRDLLKPYGNVCLLAGNTSTEGDKRYSCSGHLAWCRQHLTGPLIIARIRK